LFDGKYVCDDCKERVNVDSPLHVQRSSLEEIEEVKSYSYKNEGDSYEERID